MELQEKWSHLGSSETNGLSLTGSKEPILRSGVKRKNLSHSSIPDSFSIYRKGDGIASTCAMSSALTLYRGKNKLLARTGTYGYVVLEREDGCYKS
ncbi:hypothetical protein BGZ46_009203 [Entomortierella lignicola]|nr:hypothetical protein BGZ46_009203 [Entomortierella lignicola]